MLTEANARRFIEATLPAESEPLRQIRAAVDAHGFEHEEIFASQAPLLQLLVLASRARNVLELGTFIGYSTMAFAECARLAPDGVHVTSVERDPARIAVARERLQAAGLLDNVTLVQADARDACREFIAARREFDFIFLDTDERQYPELLEPCVELLATGSVMVIDNVLMATVAGWSNGSNVVENPEGEVESALHDLLGKIAREHRLLATVVPSGSGLAVLLKLRR